MLAASDWFALAGSMGTSAAAGAGDAEENGPAGADAAGVAAGRGQNALPPVSVRNGSTSGDGASCAQGVTGGRGIGCASRGGCAPAGCKGRSLSRAAGTIVLRDAT